MSRRHPTRRGVLKGAAAAAVLPLVPPGTGRRPQESILPLTSTSGVFVPTRGGGFNKFSFDSPEPSVEYRGLTFGFLVYTRENAYALDRARMEVQADGDALVITCSGFVWAGGQERAAGRLTARLRPDGEGTTWDVTAEMDQPIKAVTTVVRGIPRGKVSVSGGAPADHGDDELLMGYPFGAGDLFGGNTAWGMSTPLAVVEAGPAEFVALSSLDDRVRAKRFYFQPGEHGYRVECVFEAEGWLDQRRVPVPPWRVGRAATLDAAVQPHWDHLERAYHIPRWETREDVPDWLRRTALVITLHGMHYTGYVFNDFARMLEILRAVAPQISPERVLVFLSAWDGRYYWDYPLYRVPGRMGGEAGFRRLVDEGHRMGFRFMPMFGANAANRRLPVWPRIQEGETRRVDGDEFTLNWVDWDNDRHQEGWGSYMNLGVDAWREWLTGRIAETVERFGVDGYFLDISGGWMNNTRADMHEGMRRMVADLRRRFPRVLACGEFHYDALMSFLPLYHVFAPRMVPYARFFSHLSHPAPGRGSSGVHESGFGRFDPATLGLSRREGLIPTLNVVDDTFTTNREQMDAIIRRAREWAT